MIEFTADFATGVDEVDNQHRKLFETVNNLERDVKAGKTEVALPVAMTFLKGYVRHHFSVEERCMARHKCPMAEANKQAHQQLLDLFPTLEGRLASEGPTDALANDIIDYLTKWLTGHILKVDTHLRACQSVK